MAHPRPRTFLSLPGLLLGLLGLLAAGPVRADEPKPAPDTEAAPAPVLEGITIDREAGHIDLASQVVLREGEWLELLACTPNSREHESILTVNATPRHIHLALILLGLEPGAPLTFERQPDGEFKITPPSGPAVAVTLIYQADGKPVTVDANQWIVNQQTRKTLEDNHWLFTGSRFEEFDGNRVYLADPNGSVLSLVNFGDEILARSTTVTKDNDQQAWQANTPAIPPVGTDVTIRLTPVQPPPRED